MKNKVSFTIKSGEPFPIEWQTARYTWRRVKITIEKLPNTESVKKSLDRLRKPKK